MTRSQFKELELLLDKQQSVIIEEGGSIEKFDLNKNSKLVVEIQDNYNKKFTERGNIKFYVPDHNSDQFMKSKITKIKVQGTVIALLTDKRDLYIGFSQNQYQLSILSQGIDDFSIASSEIILTSSSGLLKVFTIDPLKKVFEVPEEYQIQGFDYSFQILSFRRGIFACFDRNYLVLGRMHNGIEIRQSYELIPGTVVSKSGQELCLIEENRHIYVYQELEETDCIQLQAPCNGIKSIYSLKKQLYVVLFQNGKIMKYQDQEWQEVNINIFSEDSKIIDLYYDPKDSLFYAFEPILEDQLIRRMETSKIKEDLFQKKPQAKGKPSQGLLEWKKLMIMKKKESKDQPTQTQEEKKIEFKQEQKVMSQEESYMWVYRLYIDKDIQMSFYDKISNQVQLREYLIQEGKIVRVVERKATPEYKHSNIDSLLTVSHDAEFDYVFCHQIEKNNELLESSALISQIKDSLDLDRSRASWQYHCLCKDYNKTYKFTLQEQEFEAYKRQIFSTLPFIFIRSKHPLKPIQKHKGIIQLYQFYIARALSSEAMSQVTPTWPMFQIFNQAEEFEEKEESKQSKKDYSKIDPELHGWIVKQLQKNRIRLSGTITMDGGLKAISKGFNSLMDDLGSSVTKGYSLLELEERVRTIFFRSYRCANLLSYVNLRSPDKMADSSITGIVYRKKLPSTMFFFKQAFLRTMMTGAKRGNSLGTITIDRFMSHSFARRGIQDLTGTVTVFGQVMNKIDSRAERYTSLQMNRSSQNPWEVRFAGEKGIDAGGLTRESVDELSNELQSPQLPLLIKTPNNRNQYGEQREKWILNPSSRSLRELEMFRFLGGLLASSIRGERKLILDLAGLIYKKLLNLEVTDGDLKNVDNYCVKSLEDIQNLIKEGGLNIEDLFDEKFVTCLSNGDEVELIQGGKDLQLTNDNVSQYEALVKAARKNQSNFQMNALKAGFQIVFDPCYISYFTPSQIEILICGSAEITTANFQAITENPLSSPMKKMFWEVFEQLSQTYRAKYLRFAWGRSRLPHAGESISDKHKLHNASGSKPDTRLPVGHTCFFSVDMPNYSSKEIMKEKLLYTLNNCHAIDGDGGSFVAFFDDEM